METARLLLLRFVILSAARDLLSACCTMASKFESPRRDA